MQRGDVAIGLVQILEPAPGAFVARAILTRLPRSEKLTPIETMKLAAGEVAVVRETGG